MRVAMFGILGVYNYGCEAIIRGTEKIIHYKYPDAQIDYISMSHEEDSRRLAGCNVNVVPDFPNKVAYYVKSGMNYIERNALQKLPGYKRFAFKWKYSWIKNYDIVLSIGGDIYTVGHSAGADGPFYLNVIDMAIAAKDKKIPVVIWGASIGPFEKYPVRKGIYFSHFEECISYICARENHTLSYLKSNGYKRCNFFPDPAFSVRTVVNDSSSMQEKICIGINLSPLSTRTMSNESTESDVIQSQVNTIASIVNKFRANIILIPHVVSDSSEGDDDYRYLLKIQNALEQIGITVELAPHDSSFISVKEYIVRCDVVFAARMHCAINSITCGVPPVFLSYSEKSKGMCDVVYENNNYVLPLKDFNNSEIIVGLLTEIIDNYSDIKRRIVEKSCILSKNALKNIEGIDKAYEVRDA